MRPFLFACLLATLALTGCGTGRKGSAGFHLPDGDPVKGRAVFTSLRCHSCHGVPGVDLPAPVVEAMATVELGGKVQVPRTDGEILAAIVDPSHRLAPGYERDVVASGKLSRMGDFSESLTVRELTDLVAFVQSRYEVEPPTYPHQ
jgi:mono/diheme cytochrome c family protein